MIKVSIYKSSDGICNGFEMDGHAGYAEHGHDIVCAAVSALVINTINSIEQFTKDRFDYQEDEESGHIEFRIISKVSSESTLLLNSLFLGLQGIKDDYDSKYIHFILKEV